MRVTVLYPFFDHPAIEERYASWQAQMRLRQASDDVDLVTYDRRRSVGEAASMVADEFVIVVTDPLLVPSPGLADALFRAMQSSGAEVAVPVTNESANAQQRFTPPAQYLTLLELEAAAASLPPAAPVTVTWDDSDPGAFFCRTKWLEAINGPVNKALKGRKIAIASDAYVHRWPLMRAVVREDLLPFIDANAKSILEIGCGEGALGAIVKQRQKCRYVGIEIDRDAAAVARKRIDDVYHGDVIDILEILEDSYESIICSEIVEHVEDPWSVLIDLRRVCKPGGQIVISIPNVASATVVNDLLKGRFDYTYIGLICAGHLRFFTRRSVEEMMTIAGWQIERVEPQAVRSTGGDELLRQLESSSVSYSRDDLTASGFYIVGRNPRT